MQKSCSLTGHVWDGYWVLANKRLFETLPEDLQEIVRTEIDRSALDQRADIAGLSQTLRADLGAKGLSFIDVDQEAFRAALGKTDFYAAMAREVRRYRLGAAGAGLRQARLTAAPEPTRT